MVKFLWTSDLLPIKKQGHLIQEAEQSSIFLNSERQILSINGVRDKNILYAYAFLLGVEFKFVETENLKFKSLIDKFKNDYPSLKQNGTIPSSDSIKFTKELSDSDIEDINRHRKNLEQKKDQVLKDGLNQPAVSSLTEDEKDQVKVFSNLYVDRIMREQEQLFLKQKCDFPQRQTHTITLQNDNVIITLTKNYSYHESLERSGKKVIAHYSSEGHISISIKDKKLVDHRKKIEAPLRNTIKEYNKEGIQKQKQEELKKLDF